MQSLKQFKTKQQCNYPTNAVVRFVAYAPAVILSFFLCRFPSFCAAPDISATPTPVGVNFCTIVESYNPNRSSPLLVATSLGVTKCGVK